MRYEYSPVRSTVAGMLTMQPDAIQSILIVEDDLRLQADTQGVALSAFKYAEPYCVATVARAEQMLVRHRFDMAIVDLGLPDGSGIDLIRQIHTKHPHTICLARTVFDDDEHLFGALAAGAQGYLLKGQSDESLRAQLLTAAKGDPAISPAIARKVLHFFRTNPTFSPTAAAIPHPLTPREAEILGLVGRGQTIAEVARVLQVSENTVKTHVKSAYSKLNIKSRAGAALEARRLGLA